jgi:hypothetical protein
VTRRAALGEQPFGEEAEGVTRDRGRRAEDTDRVSAATADQVGRHRFGAPDKRSHRNDAATRRSTAAGSSDSVS